MIKWSKHNPDTQPVALAVSAKAIRIGEIADHAGLSVRQFERRFLEEVGLTPKTFARTTRFQRALDAKRFFPQRTWLSIAHQFGYFDQMHMVRDFQVLGGDRQVTCFIGVATCSLGLFLRYRYWSRDSPRSITGRWR